MSMDVSSFDFDPLELRSYVKNLDKTSPKIELKAGIWGVEFRFEKLFSYTVKLSYNLFFINLPIASISTSEIFGF
jgi:hypothetical protein